MTGPEDIHVRVAEIRQENRGGDVSYRDIEWLCDALLARDRQLRELREAVGKAIGDPPDRPGDVTRCLVRRALAASDPDSDDNEGKT